jgi:crotonobetainyl-CoA:carnitine CoA-transferase CaiB-like acyl-CoA transferase
MLPFPVDHLAPLAGIRVLDASRVLAGPFCGQLLADLGAEVIKLERPGLGDDTRGWGPPYASGFDDLSAYFLSCNRGKRSLTLDISRPEGSAIFHQLLARSDVLIENLRTESVNKLGLTADSLLKQHPKLVLCSITGYGRTGPLCDAPGYDFAIQAMSGLMSITGPPDGPPYKVGVAVANVLTGLYSATAILSCLRARELSGHGYAIDLSLHDCALAAQVNVAQAYLSSGVLPRRQGNSHLQIVPYQLFETADGYLVLNVGNDSQWRSFCLAAGDPDLAMEPRFATNRQRVEYRDEVIPRVAALMRQFPTSDWKNRLVQAGVPHAIVRNYAEIFSDELTHARNMKLTVRDPAGNPVHLVGNPIHILGAGQSEPTMPPRLGQHTDQVLSELGLSTAERENLRTKGVI